MTSQTGPIEDNPIFYLLRSLVKLHKPDEWKAGLDDFAHQVRLGLIYDHLVVYNKNGGPILEPFYARAVGRGRSAEADTAWGDSIGAQAILENKPVISYPHKNQGVDRVDRPYGLALPLSNGSEPFGAVVLIRFGGPEYSPLDIEQSQGFSSILSLIMGNIKLKKQVEVLTQQCKLSTLQDNFISTITHELRSPLGFIKGYTTTLLRQDTTWDMETQQEFLRIIDIETDHLQELIDNLLDSARLQSDMLEMHLQTVRVEGLLNNILARTSLHHPEMVTNLEIIQPLKIVQADPRRLEQVFENLVSNAYKYAPGSPLWITIKSDNDSVIIQFRDEGPGIPSESHEKVFWRFFRDPQSSKETRGSGLGLYICKQIIDAHKGKISVESNTGEGTIFTISLPTIN
ncbi:MAG TPA: ATP-binding protein [Leptolinea sp.]